MFDEHPLRKYPDGFFVFIHINKTGGTSISEAIGLFRKRHLTAKEVIQMIGLDSWNRAYKFSIVRNPWDKVVSHYKYRERTNQTAMGTDKISFGEWVACTYGVEKNPFYYDNPKMFQSQVAWLRNEAGEIELDFIGRFENLAADFELIKKELSLLQKLPHLNKSEQRDYRHFYNVKTYSIVADWFAEDISYFRYEF